MGIIVAGALLLMPLTGNAQQYGGASGPGLQQILLAQYPPATTTPNGLDLAAPGTVVVLQKNNLVMQAAVINNTIQVNGQGLPTVPEPNSYVDGTIKQTGVSGFLSKLIMHGPGAEAQTTLHRFNAGEKFWVTRIQTATDGVVFTLMSDPIDGQRYHGTLKFPLPKGSAAPPEQILATVAEVLRNDADPGTSADSGTAQSVAQPADPAPAQTKTLSIGQSKSQVQALFGAPARIMQVGTKEIDFYPDMKVTFVNQKVTAVE